MSEKGRCEHTRSKDPFLGSVGVFAVYGLTYA